MTKLFNEEWTQWIRSNVDDGRDKDGIFKILLDEGYLYEDICLQMNYAPSVPLGEGTKGTHHFIANSTDTTDKSSRHAPSCRPLFKISRDSRWTAHGMCLLL
jgi:hypothetical protein